jgi:hypothetical protein
MFNYHVEKGLKLNYHFEKLRFGNHVEKSLDQQQCKIGCF